MAEQIANEPEERVAPDREPERQEQGARTPRDPEAASLALAEVQDWLGRLSLIRDMARQQPADPGRRADLGEGSKEAQPLPPLQARRARLHPADSAYILEALPRDERLIVWDLIDHERDGEILLEVSDAVR